MNNEHKMSITMLPENVTLDIFDFTRKISRDSYKTGYVWEVWGWEELARVCRRWRQIIFASPLRLHIQLRCKRGTPVKILLRSWPASFPIAIDFHDALSRRVDEDNVFAALKHSNRVCYLVLYITAQHLAKLAPVMQEQFPALTKLWLSLRPMDQPVFLDEFLPACGSFGGSPRLLQELHLDAIYFHDLPVLIYHSHDLVTLHLSRMLLHRCIPPSGMAVCLSQLTKLESLYIGFERDNSFPGGSPTTNTRDVLGLLPALTSIKFDRVCSYTEDLMARIDCPRLNSILLRYHHDPFNDFHNSHIFEFINRSEDPRLTLFSQVIMDPYNGRLHLQFLHEDHVPISFQFQNFFNQFWGASRIGQVFTQLSAKLSSVRHLSVNSSEESLGISNTDWAYILRSFTGLQTLFVSRGSVECIACALDEETADELLPTLEILCLENGPANSGAKFCSDRQLSGRPVTFVRTSTEFEESLRTSKSSKMGKKLVFF